MSATSGSRPWRAYTALILVEFVWGATFVLVKSALEDASTLLFLALRFTLAAAALAVIFRRGFSSFAVKRSLRGGLIAGGFLFCGYFFQTVGLRYTTAAKSAFITALSIVAVPLIAALVYRSRPQVMELAGVAVAVTGLGLMTFERANLSIGFGDSITMLCALAFAAHIVVVGHYSAKVSIGVLSLAQIGVVALISLGTFWWAEEPRLTWSPGLVVAILVTGLLATALAFAVQAWAQRYISPTRTALILSLEPVFAWLTAYVATGERLSRRGLAGGALIMAGVLLAELKPSWGRRHPSC